jgi:hypothetical protein
VSRNSESSFIWFQIRVAYYIIMGTMVITVAVLYSNTALFSGGVSGWLVQVDKTILRS